MTVEDINTLSLTDFQSFAIFFGSVAFGFVIGWTLYFANRGKSGKMEMADIAAMITAIAGGTVTGFLTQAVNPNVNAAALGCYGIGLFLGFVTYFLLFRWARQDTELDYVLRGSPFDMFPEQTLRRTPPRSRGASGRDPNETIAALNRLIKALAERADEANRRGDHDLADRIDNILVELGKYKRTLLVTRAIETLSSPELAEFFGVLKAETEALNAKADVIKDVAGSITDAVDFLTKAKDLVNEIGKIV